MASRTLRSLPSLKARTNEAWVGFEEFRAIPRPLGRGALHLEIKVIFFIKIFLLPCRAAVKGPCPALNNPDPKGRSLWKPHARNSGFAAGTRSPAEYLR